MDYDYIIVGAGAAGCVLAQRLSEDSGNRVLLLEYGGSDRHPMLYVPKGFYFTLKGDKFTYHYKTQPFKSDGGAEDWTRGKVLGGSTTINGMMYSRGFAADYDAIVERGNPGWGWDGMLPVFKKMEDHQLGASSTRGSGGMFGVSIPASDEVGTAIIKSAEKYGWVSTSDTNEEDVERIGLTPSSIKNGKRVSSSSAFLKPALKRPNLTHVTRVKVGSLIFDGLRVVGVRAQVGGKSVEYRSTKEVLVSAGTIESTLLLERSGIGKPEILKGAGVDLVVESPHLGERVIEQRGVAMQAKLRDPIGATQKLNTLPKQGWQGFKYLLSKKGPIATAGYDIMCQFKSSPELDRPDIQGLFIPMALDATSFDKVKLAKHSGIMYLGYQIRPTTESSVHLGGSSPTAAPIINARYLETEIDRKVTATILERGREILAQEPVAGLISEEEYPGPAVSTSEEVLTYAVDNGATIYHGIGACGMGPDDDDVVDSRLRVRGVSGLRVVDASVFKVQPAGNTAAPTMALAWRAADMILEEN